MIFRSIFIVVLLLSNFCKALDKGPEIVRICLDNNTSIVTIYWQSSVDNCSSFKYYSIYSSENSGPWIKAKLVSVFATNSCSIFLADLTSDWKFKVTTHSACNGIDSFVSIPQSIDQNKPPLIELDSVSFDPNTQKLNAGWNKNSAPDTKGYRLYNYKNSVFTKLSDTSSTYIIFNELDNTSPNELALATFDSCDQFAPISNPHQPVYLNANIDSCAKTIALNWSNYLGWSATNQYLIINRNNTGFTKFSILPANSSSFLLSNITLGDNLCYYIRTENVNTKFTSSSNTICFKTQQPLIPKYNYVNNVTVINNSIIGISYSTDGYANTDSIILEKSTDGVVFYTLLKLKLNTTNSTGLLLDSFVNINTTTYWYRLKAINHCLRSVLISNIGKSILLLNLPISNTTNELNWNLYKGWENGIEGQLLESCSDGFTWNAFKSLPKTNVKQIISEETLIEDSLCFRITNKEVLNSQNISSLSVSNIRCIYTFTDFYLPNIINPYSNNNIFSLIGNGIDYSKGSMEIFNRWGEKIFASTNLLTGWNGKINDTLALQGYYIYKVSIFDLQNNQHIKTGTLFIIR